MEGSGRKKYCKIRVKNVLLESILDPAESLKDPARVLSMSRPAAYQAPSPIFPPPCCERFSFSPGSTFVLLLATDKLSLSFRAEPSASLIVSGILIIAWPSHQPRLSDQPG